MTVKELINKLLDRPMDDEVLLCYDKEHIDERGEKCSGYVFHIDDVKGSDIMFTDWRDEIESEEYVNFADDLIPIMDEAESEGV